MRARCRSNRTVGDPEEPSAPGCELGIMTGHLSPVCDGARTINPVASINDIRAVGRADSVSEHRGQRRSRRTALQFTAIAAVIPREFELHIYALKGDLCHGRHKQDSPCHRIGCRGLAAAALRRRNSDRDRDQWRDDGQRKRGRNDLDVASHLVCRRARRRAFLKHPRKEIGHIAGSTEARASRRGHVALRLRQALATGGRQ